MNTETLQQPSSPEQQIAVARSSAFRLFVEALQYPDEELMEVIRGGQLADAIRTAFEALDPGLSEGIDWEALKDGGSGDDLGVEYTRLFDVGVSGPPCPLCGGLYTGARMKTMEEAVRFYNFFGLSLSGGPRELPDHLSTELCSRTPRALSRASAEPDRRSGRAGGLLDGNGVRVDPALAREDGNLRGDLLDQLGRIRRGRGLARLGGHDRADHPPAFGEARLALGARGKYDVARNALLGEALDQHDVESGRKTQNGIRQPGGHLPRDERDELVLRRQDHCVGSGRGQPCRVLARLIQVDPVAGMLHDPDPEAADLKGTNHPLQQGGFPGGRGTHKPDHVMATSHEADPSRKRIGPV
jgi:hypothetical protein